MPAGATFESDRLNALHSLRILDTPAEERFDRLTRVASALFDTPISTVTLIDSDRQWHKACIGVGSREDPRAVSFCAVAIQNPQPADHPGRDAGPGVQGQPAGHRIAEDELNHQELADALSAWRESEARFRAVFQDTAVGMTLIDRSGRFVTVNEAFGEMVGVPADELRGIPGNAVIHAADRDDGRIGELFAGEIEEYKAEKRHLRPDGSWFWGSVTASLLRDRDGQPDVAIGMVEDITQRREVERLKDELVAVVGHELRTPLTSIRGSLGLLEAGIAGELPDEALGMVAIARQNTERLSRLVEETLDLERLEAGRVELEARPVLPEELLATTAQVVEPVAADAGVQLRWEASEDLLLIVDADRIVQTLVNLVANAVKFSPVGATVTTSVEVQDGQDAVISVADDGRGIPADQLEAVFERFQQVEAADHREKGGTGLGLAIARAIVEQHGGRIWAESALGEGATFRFTLPARRGAEALT